MYQCLKINFKFRYLKYKISRRRARKKCNVITCIYWNSRTYVSLSRVYALYNNKCIPLTSRNFLLFYLQPFRVYIHLVSVSHRLNVKNNFFFSRAVFRAIHLCFDNMKNLEDTFRSLSRFVRHRHYIYYTL